MESSTKEDIHARHELGRADTTSLETPRRPLAAWSRAAREVETRPVFGSVLKELNRLPVGERGVVSFKKLQAEGLETPARQVDARSAEVLPPLQPTALRASPPVSNEPAQDAHVVSEAPQEESRPPARSDR